MTFIYLVFPWHLAGYFWDTTCVLPSFSFLFLLQRAGYSLQELFLLTRSQVSQQRVLALHVLSQVISRVSGLLAWPGQLHPAPSPSSLRLPSLLSFLPGMSPYISCLGMGQAQQSWTGKDFL